MAGRCWKIGDNVSTDEILSTRYMTLTDKNELKDHVFENLRPEIAKNIRPGDIIVAGENMGYGSSREHAPLAILGSGVKTVIARSFARLFYRNCINLGIAAIVCPAASLALADGDAVETDLQKGIIYCPEKGTEYTFGAFPDFLRRLLDKGGLINALNEERARN